MSAASLRRAILVNPAPRPRGRRDPPNCPCAGVEGRARRQGELHQARSDDPDAGRDEALHDHLRAAGHLPALSVPAHAHRLWHRAVRAGQLPRRGRPERPSSRARATSSSTRTRAAGSSPKGQFIHHLPFDRSGTPNESTDTYDTIEWLLKNVPNNNGRVGQWGISWDGWETSMGMIDAHPALKASSPQAPPQDQFLGDDYHSGGAYQLMLRLCLDVVERARPHGAHRAAHGALRLRHAGRLPLLPGSRRRRQRDQVSSATRCRPGTTT